MTFDEARNVLIQRHRVAVDKLHNLVVSDPNLVNPDWREVTDARSAEVRAASDLINFNEAERCVKRAPAEPKTK